MFKFPLFCYFTLVIGAFSCLLKKKKKIASDFSFNLSERTSLSFYLLVPNVSLFPNAIMLLSSPVPPFRFLSAYSLSLAFWIEYSIHFLMLLFCFI